MMPDPRERDQQCVLSPKETQEREKYQAALRQIDTQVNQILSLNSQQNSHYQQAVGSIACIQEHYQLENTQLQRDLQLLTQKYDSLQAMYLLMKEELEHTCTLAQQHQNANLLLVKEASRLKDMVANQQNLIDEYRNSIEEEVNLEREFIKSEFEQQRSQAEREFARALAQMERKYQEKLKRAGRERQAKDYQNECRELKQFISGSRQGSRKDLHQPGLRQGKPIPSQYSTVDQQSRVVVGQENREMGKENKVMRPERRKNVEIGAPVRRGNQQPTFDNIY